MPTVGSLMISCSVLSQEKDNFVGLTGFVLITLRTASALYNSTVQVRGA